jgi:hypothetical protein
MKSYRLTAIALAVAVGFGAGSVWAAEEMALKLSDKWRIEVSEGAKSDGVIRFQITPYGQAPIALDVPIQDGRGENGVAQDINAFFRTNLDANVYSVEVDDGEDVLVKKHRDAANFELRLLESTVEAVRIHVQRE